MDIPNDINLDEMPNRLQNLVTQYNYMREAEERRKAELEKMELDVQKELDEYVNQYRLAKIQTQ